MSYGRSLIILCALIVLQPSVSWVFPGYADRKEFKTGEVLPVRVNELTSSKTQVPFEYYHLPFPKPEKVVDSRETIGEMLIGSRSQTTLYKFEMLSDKQCVLLGSIPKLTDDEKEIFIQMINERYFVNISCDTLPLSNSEFKDKFLGVFVGTVNQNKQHVLFNHISFEIFYHTNSESPGSFTIVGFQGISKNVYHSYIGEEVVCDSTSGREPWILETSERVDFTYDVKFVSSEVEWERRWDSYVKLKSQVVHWFGVINSLIIVMFLSAILGLILLRTLLRDIAKYNIEIDELEDVREESGWKLVHGDVFRPPGNGILLASMVATGVQIFIMCLASLVIASVEVIRPSNRGLLLQIFLLCYILSGFPAGFIAARYAKLFSHPPLLNTVLVALLTSVMFPGVCFVIFCIINFTLATTHSSASVHVPTIFVLLALWFLVTLPLVFFGARIGSRRKSFVLPVRTNQIPRQIPPSRLMGMGLIACAVGGFLPFGAVFIEFSYVLSSLWLYQYIYFFGFLLTVLLVLVVTCSEISITFVYFQLTSEDYRWWWRSYLISAASGVYVFLYALLYLFLRLGLTKPISVLIFVGYMFLLSYAFFMLTGAVGFISTFWFVRKIYSSIKVE